jgi:ribonuclease P protein component
VSRDRRSRLTDSPEFERVYKRGKVYRGRFFSVHAFPNDVGIARLGLSVSRKVGTAVVRNAVQRRMREIFHAELGGSNVDLDFVVSAKPPAAQASFWELRAEFKKASEKLKIGAVRSEGPTRL